MKKTARAHIFATLIMAYSSAFAELANPIASLGKLPVREITVFKDGYVFVNQEGNMPVDAKGDVRLEDLPSPVLGTFWAYCSEPGMKLSSVTAGKRRVMVNKTSLTIKELLEGNIGAQIEIIEAGGKQKYRGVIMSIPSIPIDQNIDTTGMSAINLQPAEGNILLLKTDQGILTEPLDKIEKVLFLNGIKTSFPRGEYRNALNLKLKPIGAKNGNFAQVGFQYLQYGIRWIPSYKITLDGKGNARVEMQATLVNDIIDLNDVDATLVVGVPKFQFAGQIDPIALQQTIGTLESHFARNNLSNALMTQVPSDNAGIINPPSGPDVMGGEKNEDLYVYNIKHLSLRKGERQVIPIANFRLKYTDLYQMDVPYTPPIEVQNALNGDQAAQIASLQQSPQFTHVIRLKNDSGSPLTTAPALLFSDGGVLAQSMMTYTPSGASVDVKLNTAIDISVKKEDKETDRALNAITWQNQQYGQVSLSGSLLITNHKDTGVELEINRYVLGIADNADHDGVVEMTNVLEKNRYVPGNPTYPNWWGWYNWPDWWYHFNGIGQVHWRLHLDAGKSVELRYNWHYFWR
jgi:hypothetical protein